MREVIYKHALKNAIDYGKANPKAVLGKVLAEMPELKEKLREILPLIDEVVKEVNTLSKEKREEEIKRYEFVEKEEKKKGLPELVNPVNVRLRFAPNPSGPLHLGHARAAILNDEYAKRYGGELILRFEDTDPTRVDPRAYEMIKEDLEWLGVKCHKTIIQSERLEIYYEHAKKLIEMGNAYVCTCDQEKFQRTRVAKKACECRGNPVAKNLKIYEKMFTEYKEGEAVVRLKTSLDLPDPSMRDYPIMRISDQPHPKVGRKKVYPLMNFSVTIDDHLTGLTHVLRGKDHIVNTKKQEFIYNYFRWEMPEFIHYGRLKIEGLALSTSRISKGIKEGQYSGWDDAKLGTLRAMKRRGIQPEAIRKAILDVGVKETDISFSWKNLYAYNRNLIEANANRYFFVENPREIIIENSISKVIKAPLHPDFPERGYRKLEITAHNREATVFISESDFANMNEGDFFRLMEAFNVEILRKDKEKMTAKFHSEALEEARNRKARLIQWVSRENIGVKIVSPEGISEGLGEENLKNVRVGDIIQFERYGFVRVDKKDKKIVVYFTHK
jgi:glutamyl-tRNA synthetase